MDRKEIVISNVTCSEVGTSTNFNLVVLANFILFQEIYYYKVGIIIFPF